MSQNQNVASLDFTGEQSLSFESFFDNGKQYVERALYGSGFCICVDLTEAGTVSLKWNGEQLPELSLSAGRHELPLNQYVPAGDGDLSLQVNAAQQGAVRSYRLVHDYTGEYSEFMFRLHAGEREAARLARLNMQCPAPQEGQTLKSLSDEKFLAAAAKSEELHRLLGGLVAINVSHLLHISVQSGDESASRCKLTDNHLEQLSGSLRQALAEIESIKLDIEHARHYHDQRKAGN